MKRLSIFVLVVTVFVLMGCSTFIETSRPFSAHSTFPADASTYQILGEVYVEGEVGYLDLLTQAKATYPTCDDVVNIKADVRTASTENLFFLVNSTVNYYSISGIAIKYNK